MKRLVMITALGGCALLALASPAIAGKVFKTTTNLEISSNGVSGQVHSPNPKCLKGRRVSVRMDSKLGHQRFPVTETDGSGRWHVSFTVPDSYLIEVGVEAKQLSHDGPYANSCGPAAKFKSI
jgi:hypothetical protein